MLKEVKRDLKKQVKVGKALDGGVSAVNEGKDGKVE